MNEAGYKSARSHALLRQTAIREFAAKYHNEVALAFSPVDVNQILLDEKKVVFQSMKNAYPLGTDLSLLEHFYMGGLRMVGPVHFSSNQFADSSTDENQPNEGLSPLGMKLVREANRLGIIIDGSHSSDQATRDMIATSETPIILSHTGAKAIYDHPRNVSDALLLELAESGGVIQMNVFGDYLEKLEPSEERAEKMKAMKVKLITPYGSIESVPSKIIQSSLVTLNKQYPASRSTYKKFMEHTFHTLNLIGVDHVGISGDWDGGGGVIGLSDVSMLQQITHDLLNAGYSKTDVEKVWAGNVMRLMQAAQSARKLDVGSLDIAN